MFGTVKKQNVEISVKRKQQLEKFRFVGKLEPKPNQRVFQLDLNKGVLSEVEYFYKSDTVSILDVMYGKIPDNRAVLIQDGFDYVIKLNLENALKYFRKKFPEIDIEIIKTSTDLDVHSRLNAYRN